MAEPTAIARRWPEIIYVLGDHGLEGKFLEAQNPDELDAIEVRRCTPDGEEGTEVGDIMITRDGWFYAYAWSDTAHETRRTGEEHPSAESACRELVQMLQEDGLL